MLSSNMSLTLRPDWIVAWIPDVNLANALYSIPEPVVSLLYGSYVPDVSPMNSLASTGFWNLAPYTLPTTGFSRTEENQIKKLVCRFLV